MNYQNLYKILRGINLPQFKNLAIPTDKQGIDIFKSTEKEWKIQNDFSKRFLELIDVITYCTTQKDNPDLNKVFYDFRDFIFPARLVLNGLTFSKTVDFGQTCFEESVKIQNCRFEQGFYAGKAVFKSYFAIEKQVFMKGLYMRNCQFYNTVTIDGEVLIQDFALFDDAHFHNCLSLTRTTIEGETRFSRARFKTKDRDYEVRFEAIEVSDIDFEDTQFDCGVVFEDVHFKGNSTFVNTIFSNNAETTFMDCFVGNQLFFKSTHIKKKLFQHKVFMSFAETGITGRVLFENVNFEHISQKQRQELVRLSKFEKVHIGKGCLKYRFVSAIRVIKGSINNQNLITDFAKTFASFFSRKGINLGIEIVYQDVEKTEFFYFSDDENPDLTPAEFARRLSDTEMEIFSPFFQFSQIERSNTEGVSETDNFLNRLELNSTVNHYFERIRLKIARQEWTEQETAQFLNALSFAITEGQTAVLPEEATDALLINQNELGIPPRYLHQLIIENYPLAQIFKSHTSRLQTQDFTKLIGEPKTFKEKIQLLVLQGDIDEALLHLKNHLSSDIDNEHTVLLWANQLNSLLEYAKWGKPKDDIEKEYQRICSNILRFVSGL